MFGVFVPLENFHSFVEVTITGKELHILTDTRHLLPLSSEGSLTCHIYCDTGQPFKMVTSEDPWHSHLGCGALTTCFNDLGLYRPGTDLLFEYTEGMSDISILLPFKIDNSIIYGNELDRDLDFMLYSNYIVEKRHIY